MTLTDQNLMDMMKIDCNQVCQAIEEFIKHKVADGNHNGVLLGVSGGVDSSVAVKIAVRAMNDPKKVWGMHLYDRDSMKKFREHSVRLAEALEINFQVMNISDNLREQKTYDPLIMKAVPYSPLINKMILLSNKILSPIFYGVTPFEVTLKRIDPSKIRFGFVAGIAKSIENGYNDRHILRRKILEDFAEEKNLLLIGAANKSESFVGWFVKDGVDDMPIEILMGLYKNQVKQIADFLDIPENILGEAPSPDMFKGLGDEDLIGHKYDQIDKVAFVAQNKLPVDILFVNGVSKGEYENIMRIHELSEWKRENPHEYPTF